MDIVLLQKLVGESPLSKSQISNGAGISRTTLDNALTGADIKVSTIENLSKVLGVECNVFFDEVRSRKEKITATPQEKDGEEILVEEDSAEKDAPQTQETSDDKFTPTTFKTRRAKYEALYEFKKSDVLQEKISYLEDLISEKDRLIGVLILQVELLTGKKLELPKKKIKMTDFVRIE